MLNGLFFQQLVKQCRLSQTVPDCARLAALRFCALMSRSSSGEADLDTVGSRQGSSQPQATLPCPSLSHLDIPRPCHTMSKTSIYNRRFRCYKILKTLLKWWKGANTSKLQQVKLHRKPVTLRKLFTSTYGIAADWQIGGSFFVSTQLFDFWFDDVRCI